MPLSIHHAALKGTSYPSENGTFLRAVDMECREKLDCRSWLGQQSVMFDQRGITLKDVIRMVATFEGAHSINVSRVLRTEEEKLDHPSKHSQRHLLDNVTIFVVKYTHTCRDRMRLLFV